MRFWSLVSSSSLMLLVLVTGSVSALPPWQLLRLRHIEANPDKSYELVQENGPWCILVTTFAGERAEEVAHDLVLELRREFKIEAYIHRKHYDFTQNVGGLGVDRYGSPKRMRYIKPQAFDEVAVLAGNFDSVDDPGIEKMLTKIKYAEPKTLKDRENSPQRFANYRAAQRAAQRMLNRGRTEKFKGPMGNAFVTRNPLIPKEFFAPGGLDKTVQTMNDGVPHSLLDCPKKYTVKVASFRGNVVLDQKKIFEIEQGGGMKSSLDKAAEKAHKLTEALRKQGFEAYEFHDRHESIVTVGSFDTVGTPRRDGRTEINPGVHQIMKEFSAQQKELPGGATLPGLQPRTLNGIAFDVQPVPVEVPRRSIAADYARDSRFFR